MADNPDGKSNSLLLGLLLGADEPVVKIDVPGFSGEIRKDNGGVDIEVGKDKP